MVEFLVFLRGQTVKSHWDPQVRPINAKDFQAGFSPLTRVRSTFLPEKCEFGKELAPLPNSGWSSILKDFRMIKFDKHGV